MFPIGSSPAIPGFEKHRSRERKAGGRSDNVEWIVGEKMRQVAIINRDLAEARRE
jgi:hypothetical protein